MAAKASSGSGDRKPRLAKALRITVYLSELLARYTDNSGILQLANPVSCEHAECTVVIEAFLDRSCENLTVR